MSVLAETKLTAVFGKSGSLSGFAGCNDYNATYKATAPKISIGPVASTRKHCEEPAGVTDQESSYLAALETAATYRVEGSRLELRTADGALAVELKRKCASIRRRRAGSRPVETYAHFPCVTVPCRGPVTECGS